MRRSAVELEKKKRRQILGGLDDDEGCTVQQLQTHAINVYCVDD